VRERGEGRERMREKGDKWERGRKKEEASVCERERKRE
jgi:hypothetical protein